MRGGWIGVDLDGTLAVHEADFSVERIGPPVELMVARVKHWVASGVEVRIVTARIAPFGDIAFEDRQRALIQAWCLEHVGQVLPVTATKDFYMLELWDDRAVRVAHNTGQVCLAGACIGSGQEAGGER